MTEVLVDLGMFALFAIAAVSGPLYLAGPKDQPPFGQEDEALMALTPTGEAAAVDSVRRDWARNGCRCGCGDAA